MTENETVIGRNSTERERERWRERELTGVTWGTAITTFPLPVTGVSQVFNISTDLEFFFFALLLHFEGAISRSCIIKIETFVQGWGEGVRKCDNVGKDVEDYLN